MDLQVMPRAEKFLKDCQKKDQKLLGIILNAVDELAEKHLEATNIKSLTGVSQGFRKRVGRHRILFTVHYEEGAMKIWIIDIEKDTKKDYQKWIAYLNSQL